MRSARQRFLACLPAGAAILDFGCGSGRDAKAFLELGFSVEASDGSEELCRRASELTWITADVRPGREEERWINILARRGRISDT